MLEEGIQLVRRVAAFDSGLPCCKAEGNAVGDYPVKPVLCGSRSPGSTQRYEEGLKAFNVLAALATGGLGVSGLEAACGLPYPAATHRGARGAT